MVDIATGLPVHFQEDIEFEDEPMMALVGLSQQDLVFIRDGLNILSPDDPDAADEIDALALRICDYIKE